MRYLILPTALLALYSCSNVSKEISYNVNLRWGNYSALKPHTPERSGKAMLKLGN